MAWKIYKSGAFVICNDTVTGNIKELNSEFVQIQKTSSVDVYEVLYNGASQLKVNLADIKDENGSAYSENAWDTFRLGSVGSTNSTSTAADVTYDGTTSGLAATSVQAAIDETVELTEQLTTATATADGLTTGLLSGSNQFVTVTSSSANNIICLPSDSDAPIGTVIRGWVGANGFELRPIAAEAATAKINNITTSVEAAIPATTLFKVEKVASLTWILTATDELGAVITAIIPDAI